MDTSEGGLESLMVESLIVESLVVTGKVDVRALRLAEPLPTEQIAEDIDHETMLDDEEPELVEESSADQATAFSPQPPTHAR